MAVRAGTVLPFPLSLDSPSSYAAWTAALIFSMVAVSDLGMIREMLYLGALPLIDFVAEIEKRGYMRKKKKSGMWLQGLQLKETDFGE